TQGLASAVFGFYAGAVYLTPILGGLLADRLLGRRRTIIAGALLMATGHFLMAFEQPFLVALLCLVLGNGCFKGNIASQVGGLYPKGDHRAADAFQIFYLGINGGVIAAPLICGTLGEKVGWHWGFAAAGIGMLLGLTIYLSGTRYLPPEVRAARGGAERVRLKPGEGKVLLLLILMLPVFAVLMVGNQEIFNAYLVWAQRTADLNLMGHPLPITWLITLDTIASVSFLAGAVVFWQTWARYLPEPDELTKIIIGAIVSVTGFLTLAAAAAWSATTGLKIGIGWLVAFHVLNSIGFANILPVSLALYSRSAPAALGATILGVYYLHLFAANTLVGWVGGLLDKMPATQFWLLHAAMAGAAAVVFMVVKPLFGGLLGKAPSAAGS
ncbi:MAG: amino acid/peptide transporter, partial [Caulobacteraceae bacterium]|nr:amino acid/peptide transporter [Caulobacteraceae bacterium]